MKIKIGFLLLAITCGVFYLYPYNNTELDYSETQWRTFYGKKPVNYRPEFWVTYYTDTDDCREFGTFSLLDGSAVPKKIYKEFLAEDKENGTSYVIRYPNKFKIGKCMYYSGGGQLYIEEKSDDPRLNEEPYSLKNRIQRRTLIYAGDVSTISLVSDLVSDSYVDSNMYLNNLSYNVFCYKVNGDYIPLNISRYNELRCSSSSVNNGVGKYMQFDFYSKSFWTNNADIEFNFKISKQVYCIDDDSYCNKTKLKKFNKEILNAKTFQIFFKEQSYD